MKNKDMKIWRLTILALLLIRQPANALTLDFGLFYLSDTLTVDSNTTSTRLMGDFAVTINLDRKGQWVIGWSYNTITITESGDNESEFGLTEMGPRLGYYIDKGKIWSLFFTYNMQSQADYSSGVTNAEWRGTSMKGELGFTPAFGENYHAGVRLNYFTASFDEQFTDGTTFSTISNKRSIIYPTFAFIYRFQ